MNKAEKMGWNDVFDEYGGGTGAGEHVVTYVTHYQQDDGDGEIEDVPCDILVYVLGSDEHGWILITRDDAGGSPDDAGTSVYRTRFKAVRAARRHAADHDESICPKCGEQRTTDGLDAGGNSISVAAACACIRERDRLAQDLDPAGEWAVLDMDGCELSRHATEDGANARCRLDYDAFHHHLIDTHQASSGAYQPRSVVHLCAKPQRAGLYSTSWFTPGCAHGERG